MFLTRGQSQALGDRHQIKKVRNGNEARGGTGYSNAVEKMEIWISKCREMQIIVKFWDDVRLQLVDDGYILIPTLHA